MIERTEKDIDVRLVDGVLAGEREAFRALMQRHNQRVYRAARSVLRDDVEAEDAAQQAWLSIFVHITQWDGRARFGAWAARISVNEALRRVRKRKQEWSMEGHNPRAVPTPEQSAARKEVREVIEQAIDGLPSKLRVVVVLRDLQELTGPETANALGLTAEAVRVRLHRGRKMLRATLGAPAAANLDSAFPFLGPRCENMVRSVLLVLEGAGQRNGL